LANPVPARGRMRKSLPMRKKRETARYSGGWRRAAGCLSAEQAGRRTNRRPQQPAPSAQPETRTSLMDLSLKFPNRGAVP
jgi:hypothetical protein